MEIDVQADYRQKMKEKEKKDKYLDLISELKKEMKTRVSVTNCSWRTRNTPPKDWKRLEDLLIKKTETITLLKSARIFSRNLCRLSVNLTSVKEHLQALDKKKKKTRHEQNILANGICTNQNRSDRNRRINETDDLILARRPDLVIINSKNCCLADFSVQADHRVKIKENKKKC